MIDDESATIIIPPKLLPIFEGVAQYRGAYGGRGSGKTRSFAKMAALRGYEMSQAGIEGSIVCGREYFNSLEDSSLPAIKWAIRSEPFLNDNYEIGEKFVRTRDRRIKFIFAGMRRSLGSIRSKEQVRLLWVDEAEDLSQQAWDIIRPTVREDGAEMWATWNPFSPKSPTSLLFRERSDPMIKVTEMNWRDNPWFTDRLNWERLQDKENNPEKYDWIWEGDYAPAVEGAYYATKIKQAEREGRIAHFPWQRLQPVFTTWDLGYRDFTTVWVWQKQDKYIILIDYLEGSGQNVAYYGDRLNSLGYEGALCYLPHDAVNMTISSESSVQTQLNRMKFKTVIVPRQPNAAMKRIDATRDIFGKFLFSAKEGEAGERVKGGIARLRDYHEKIVNGIRHGPMHDEASHCGDAFGMIGTVYTTPKTNMDDYFLHGVKEEKSGWA